MKPKSLYGKKSIKRPEQIIQIGVAKELYRLEAACNQEDFFFFHPANGGKRTLAEAGIFQAMGVRAGVSDLFIMFPAINVARFDEQENCYIPIGKISARPGTVPQHPRLSIIEYKAVRGKMAAVASDDQDKFGQLMIDYGFDWHLVGARDIEDGLIQTLRIMRPLLESGCRTAKVIDQYLFAGGVRI